MKPNPVAIIVSLAALAACGIAWLALPSLQEPQRAVNYEASLQLERARRLLAKYSVSLANKSLLLDRLYETGVDVDVEDPADLVAVAADDYQAHHEALWEEFQPTDWSEHPRLARAGYGNLERQIREGINGRTAHLEENEQWLDDALDAIDEALSLSVGSASSRTYAEAYRLKGIILYHQGVATRLAAQAKRRDADPYRRELAALALDGATYQTRKSLVADSGLDEQILTLKAKVAESEALLEQDGEALANVDDTINDLEARLAAAQAQRNQARDAAESILTRGVDFSDPNGANSFRDELLRYDAVFREADRRVEALRAGTLPNAEIDFTGDLLSGRYLENGSPDNLTVEYGLTHYQNERGILAARIDKRQQAIDALQSNAIMRLERMKQTYQEEQDRAAQRMTEAVSAAQDKYAELNRLESEAFAIEEDAIELFEDAARASEEAADCADEWLRDAQDRTQGISPEARQRSAFAERSDDAWMRGHIIAQAADARLAKAWVYYDRYQAYSQTANTLETLTGSVALREADINDVRTKATEAHDAGIDEITEAMAQLHEAHSDAERHWTITAQAGGANYLLSLFGHPEYVGEAIEAYRKAVQGREDSKVAEKFVTRLRQLEDR